MSSNQGFEFPAPTVIEMAKELDWLRQQRRSLRDEFAMHAMAACLSTLNCWPNEGIRARVAAEAYATADAMLAARRPT